MIMITKKLGERLEISFERLSSKQINTIQTIPGQYVVNKNLWSIPDSVETRQILKELFFGEKISIQISDLPPAKPFRDVINDFEVMLKLRGYSPKTRKTYKTVLLLFIIISKKISAKYPMTKSSNIYIS